METLAKLIGIVGVLIVAVAVTIIAMGVIFALPTMWLWNWLMPEIFGLTAINLWQALGLNALCGILFQSPLRVNCKD